jgi:hypothetical protein
MAQNKNLSTVKSTDGQYINVKREAGINPAAPFIYIL